MVEMPQIKDRDKLIERARSFARPYRISNGGKFRLKDFKPEDTAGLSSESRPRAKAALQMGISLLAQLQDMLYAQNRWALLLIFQAMDAAGKDGAIKHVMSGVNPQGCEVYSFKSPSANELDHDFLWRTHLRTPARGRIGIFNRSYYEEVLVVRVHPQLLHTQKLPPNLVTKRVWNERFKDICNFERHLTRNGTMIRKFFLYLSPEEQRRRFLDRLDDPRKHWKFSEADTRERPFWKNYMNAYEDMIRHTATDYAPWYVIPADKKWFTRMLVAAAIIDALVSMDLHYPKVGDEQLKGIARARAALLETK